jgi:nicotinamide mononucleotide transporter
MISKIKNFISGECSGWKTGEIIWFCFCVTATIISAIILNDKITGITAAVTGIFYTLLAGKGKISCYLFGIVNSLLYGWLSFEQKLYGEVMLNWGWYFPMMFAGLFFWRKNLGEQQIIRKTKLSTREKIVFYLLTLIGITVYAVILHYMKDSQPLIDSATTVLSVTAMILTVKRCANQWLMWTIVNILSVWMWFRVFQLNGESAALLAMWFIALANGIIFWVQWYKDIKKCKTN